MPLVSPCRAGRGRSGATSGKARYGHWEEVDLVSLPLIVSPMHSVRVGCGCCPSGFWCVIPGWVRYGPALAVAEACVASPVQLRPRDRFLVVGVWFGVWHLWSVSACVCALGVSIVLLSGGSWWCGSLTGASGSVSRLLQLFCSLVCTMYQCTVPWCAPLGRPTNCPPCPLACPVLLVISTWLRLCLDM